MAQEKIIKPLRDPETGKQVYPIGYTGAVYNKDGLSVDSLIDTLKTSISNAEQSIKNNKSAINLLQGLESSNFLGIQDTTANAQQFCTTKGYEIGWALIGTDISSLTAYRITPSSAEQIGDSTYDFTDFDNIKSELDTLGSNVSELEGEIRGFYEDIEKTEPLSGGYYGSTTFVEGAGTYYRPIDVSKYLGKRIFLRLSSVNTGSSRNIGFTNNGDSTTYASKITFTSKFTEKTLSTEGDYIDVTGNFLLVSTVAGNISVLQGFVEGMSKEVSDLKDKTNTLVADIQELSTKTDVAKKLIEGGFDDIAISTRNADGYYGSTKIISGSGFGFYYEPIDVSAYTKIILNLSAVETSGSRYCGFTDTPTGLDTKITWKESFKTTTLTANSDIELDVKGKYLLISSAAGEISKLQGVVHSIDSRLQDVNDKVSSVETRVQSVENIGASVVENVTKIDGINKKIDGFYEDIIFGASKTGGYYYQNKFVEGSGTFYEPIDVSQYAGKNIILQRSYVGTSGSRWISFTAKEISSHDETYTRIAGYSESTLSDKGESITFEVPVNAKRLLVSMTAGNIVSLKGQIYGYDDKIRKLEEQDVITKEYLADIDEYNIANNGIMQVFPSVGVCGDSLSIGAIVIGGDGGDEDAGLSMSIIRKDLSWPAFSSKMMNNTWYNFSQGGISTKTYFSGGADVQQMWDGEHKACAYYIALVHNDYNYVKNNYAKNGYASIEAYTPIYIGSKADIDFDNYNNNADTYYGNYAKIIQKIKEMQPQAKIFLITAMSVTYAAFNAAINQMSHLFSNVYIIDMSANYPTFPSWHYLNGHGSAIGYRAYARRIIDVTDRLIMSHPNLFTWTAAIDGEKNGKPVHTSIPDSACSSVDKDGVEISVTEINSNRL